MSEIAIVLMWATVVALVTATIFMLYRNHQAMNSRLSELLVTTKALARAEGFKAGQEDYLDDLRRTSNVLDNKEPDGA